MTSRSRRRLSSTLVVSIVFALVGFAQPQFARAVTNDITLYLSPPLVQGSEASGALLESFDSFSVGACPTTVATGSLTVNRANACSINATSDVSGASTTGSSPTYGGSGSNSPGTGWYNPGDPIRTITFGFTNPARYVGFWWSGGSPGNVVEFLNSGVVVASYDSTQMDTFLGANAPSSWPSGNGAVTSADSASSYPKGYYFGNPRGFSANPPTGPSSITGGSRDAQYVFFNLYMPGSMTIDAVRFSGPGFEFDNLVTSTTTQTPPGSFVFADSIPVSNVVTFNANAVDATGTMNPQASASSANLTANAFVRPGYSFAGWTTEPGGGGTPYSDGQSYDFSADLTLYAQWTQNPPSDHTVTFEPNGASGSSTTQTGAGTVALDANPFTRDGYVFAGWNTEQNGSGTPYADGADFDFAADQTLWAQWDVSPTPPPAPTPDIGSLVNTGLSVLGPVGLTGVLAAFGAPFFFVSDRFRRMRAQGAVILHRSEHLIISSPARFFDRLRSRK